MLIHSSYKNEKVKKLKENSNLAVLHWLFNTYNNNNSSFYILIIQTCRENIVLVNIYLVHCDFYTFFPLRCTLGILTTFFFTVIMVVIEKIGAYFWILSSQIGKKMSSQILHCNLKVAYYFCASEY